VRQGTGVYVYNVLDQRCSASWTASSALPITAPAIAVSPVPKSGSRDSAIFIASQHRVLRMPTSFVGRVDTAPALQIAAAGAAPVVSLVADDSHTVFALSADGSVSCFAAEAPGRDFEHSVVIHWSPVSAIPELAAKALHAPKASTSRRKHNLSGEDAPVGPSAVRLLNAMRVQWSPTATSGVGMVLVEASRVHVVVIARKAESAGVEVLGHASCQLDESLPSQDVQAVLAPDAQHVCLFSASGAIQIVSLNWPSHSTLTLWKRCAAGRLVYGVAEIDDCLPRSVDANHRWGCVYWHNAFLVAASEQSVAVWDWKNGVLHVRELY
jgi:hypothetical protein